MTQKKDTDKQVPPPPPPKETDPQEHMKGPLSSTMQGIKEEAETNDQDRSHDENSAMQGDTENKKRNNTDDEE
ncbi:MAG: hypothetical protein P0Y53_05930 [Candidatus Pseudobacter hemicellulosilyticus]|uniref:Uncharacterized protein n=1 Tax=Candidatus Pseudobacter hemicellulosilyticus TaxID=3121375 RepID=A0AAJ5WZ46_9BACT|nr:MAG: hypothetical protein P0Y53_05930 [Pseudobacter sp.]